MLTSAHGTIVLAGATGTLGGLVARALLERGAKVRALVRPGRTGPAVDALRARGATIVEVDLWDAQGLAAACAGSACVVSALAGLHKTVVEGQTRLLDAALEARVQRFIPSDYALDFYKLPDGRNRNLDDRRHFAERLEGVPIAPTSVLCGMFMGMLTGPAPIVLLKRRRVAYWGDPDQPMDFTAVEDAATYTAAAALDAETPRFLRIAGDVQSARGLAAVASEVTGATFKLLRLGGLRRLGAVIALTKLVSPGRDEVYPPWQGMQYLRDMLDGRARLQPLDNDRYPMQWTTVRDLLAAHVRGGGHSPPETGERRATSRVRV